MRPKIYYHIFYILLLILYNKSFAIVLKSIALTLYEQEQSYFNTVVKKFNNYAKENNIDIELNVILYTPSNSSNPVIAYTDTLEHLLNRHSTKYDLFFFNLLHTSKYSSYFIDLNEYIPEYIDLYASGIGSSTCSEDNRWIGLPVYINYCVLYSNKELLNKYNKEIPKSWNELYETAKYIYEEEQKAGNTDIIGFNGIISVSDEGLQSIREFVYSYRNSVNSTFPSYRSKEAIDALKMIKKLKTELLPDDISRSDVVDADMRIFSGKSVFLKFWKYDKANSIYEQTNLLGGKEGISGTTIGGSSVGVNKYISDENKKYALEVIKFMLSKEVQKQMILDYKVFSAMRDLYDDEEVCKAVNCDLINNVQMIQDPKILYNYDYYIQFKTFLTNYLKKNESEAESVEETSGKLDDITKIYHVSIGTEDSILGLVVFIIIMVLIVLMVFSIIFLFIPKYESYFEFLSKDFWILIVIGSISGLGTILTLYGEMVPYKCFLNSLFVCFSSTFRIIPILQKLISNFPGENKILQWIKNNERLFVWTCIINDAFINFLLYIMWFDVMNVYIPYNKNYTICVMLNPFAAFITFISSLEKIAVLFLVILFLFMEWNIKSTKKDIKTVSYAFMLNSSVFFLILTFNFVNFTDYFGFFFIISSLNILFSVSNFFFIYGARIVWIFKKNDLDVEKKNKVKERKLESVLMKFKLSTYDEDKNGNNADENAAIDYKTSTTYSNSKSIISKVINYHYYTGEQKSDNFNIELSSKFLSNQNYAETINIYNTSTFRKKNNANKPTVNNLFNNCNGNNNITDTTNNSTTTTTTNNTNTNNTNTNNNNTNNTNTNNNNTNNTNTNNNNTNMNTNTNTNTNNTNTSNTNTNMNTNINTNTNTNTNTNDIII